MHGSTFVGNPVSCAAGISVISRIDDNLLLDVAEKGEYIKNALTGCKGVKSVSGLGLMIGIETEKDAGEVIKYCIDNGVLVIKAKNKVRLLPALNIPKDLLEKAVNVIVEACK
jgi:acetylornithine/N-succinyldiaminopimelate aminotransferase